MGVCHGRSNCPKPKQEAPLGVPWGVDRRLKYPDSGVTSSYTHSTVSSGLFVGRFITPSSSIAAVHVFCDS